MCFEPDAEYLRVSVSGSEHRFLQLYTAGHTTEVEWTVISLCHRGGIRVRHDQCRSRLFLLGAIFAQWIDPYGLGDIGVWEMISAKILFGTDNLSRDLLSRMIYGAQTTILTRCWRHCFPSRWAQSWASQLRWSAAGSIC